MKILLVHKFWRKVGGAEIYFQDVARILRAHGHEIKIYTTDYEAAGGSDIFVRDENVIFGTSVDYLDGSILSRISNIPKVIYSRKNKQEFSRLLSSFQPDVVHVFAIYTTITPSILDACSEAGIPVVMSCNDYKHICPNYRLFHHGKICEDCKDGKFYNAVLNNCCKHSFGVSVVSAVESYTHAWLNIWKKNISVFLFESRFMMNKTNEFWGKNSAQLEYLGKPFPSSSFAASPEDERFVLYAGRLSDEKGVDVLIRAMKTNSTIPLKIAGEGEYRHFLESLTLELALKNVEFLGQVQGNELDKLFNKCTFVVVPSLWFENFPYVMMEANARAKAVIGSDKGGIPEYIIEGETGFVFPAKDSEKLAELIQKLFENPSQAKRMGLKAKALADSLFDDETFYLRLSAIYQKVSEKTMKKSEFST